MFQMRNVRDSGTIALINNDIHNLRHICVSGKESKEWPSLQLACTCSCITAVIFKKLKLQKCRILPSREGIPGRHVSNATRSIQSSMKDCQHEAWRKNQLIFTITGCDSNRNIKDDFAFSAWSSPNIDLICKSCNKYGVEQGRGGFMFFWQAAIGCWVWVKTNNNHKVLS